MSELFDMLEPEAAADRFGRGPVAAYPYYDKAWYEDEVESIFKRTWLHVGHICELPQPGNFVRRDIEFAHAPLLIVHGKDGQIRTFYNVCTHRGTQLIEERAGKRNQFSCRYHRWTFGTDGRLVSAPDFERFYVSKEDCGLKEVQTQILAGMIFINLDPEPKQSVRQHFGDLAEVIETLPVAQATDFTEWSYEIEANWKLHFDNFQENYHLRFIHPQTGAQIIGPENPFGYPTHYGFCGPHRSQQLWKNPNPPPLPDSLKMAALRGAQLAPPFGGSFQKVDMKLFPCFHIVWPSPESQFTHTMFPVSATRTRGSVRIYWVNEAESPSRVFTREYAAMALRDVLTEDRHAIEAGQRGIASGVLDKVNFQDHEVLLRHLYQQVEQRVTAYRAERARKGGAA